MNNFIESNLNAKDFIEGKNYFREAISSLQKSALEVSSLFESKNIPYCLIGGLALSYYNVARGTEDLDFIIDCSYEELKQKTFGKIKFFSPRRAVLLSNKMPIDFLYIGDRNGKETIEMPESSQVKGVEVVTLSRLIELKLIANRAKDIGDIQQLIQKNSLPEDYMKKSSYHKDYEKIWKDTIKLSDDEIDRLKFIRGF